MKNLIIKIALSFCVILTLSSALAHKGEGQRIVIEQEGTGHYQAGRIEFAFQLFDTESKKSLSDLDLNESHTKKLHFISYDAALKEFNHAHPIFDGKTWNVTLDLPVNGKYFFWAQGELVDKTEFTSIIEVMIMDGTKENPVLPLGDVRTATDASTKIVLAGNKIRAGKMTMLDFSVSRTDGQNPDLTPYLGAFAHVIATPNDGDQLIHVHPQAGNKPNTGMLHATFPNPGDYRLWLQIIDRGELKIIPLSVSVSK